MNENVEKALKVLREECRELLYSKCSVPCIDVNTNSTEWPLQFYRDYVSKNTPVIIKNGCKHFPATKKWNVQYFMQNMPEKDVTIAVTPNGYADGILQSENPDTNIMEDLFVLPEEKVVKMKFFLENIVEPIDNVVCYIQQQNSNLTEHFPELLSDVDTSIVWANEAFNKTPDAVNFWLGDTRAITSMHKDFYENIYCVIDGYKDFILIPPSDLPNITYKKYKVAQFENVTRSNFGLKICKDDDGAVQTVPWISNDPLKCDKEKFPLFQHANMHKVRLEKGDCLYLPSMWFHHVQQSQGCVAVNYWYDMDFDVKFCYYKMLESLSDSAE